MDLEETLLEKKSEFKEVSTKVNGMFEKAPVMFRAAYEQLRGEEEKYSSMANKLKVPFNLAVPKEQCEIELEQIEENIKIILQNLSSMIENADFNNPQEAISSASVMQKYGESARRTQDTQNVLFDMVKDYSDEASFETQKELDEKVQRIIIELKMRLLDIKKQDLQNRRVSFLGRLFGAEELREIEIANLELEESILRSTPLEQKTSYSAADSLADMRAFVIKDLDKQDTSYTKAVFGSSLEVFGLSADVIDEKAQRKLHSVPMVIVDSRRKPRTSERIQKAKTKNSNLKAELLEVNNSANRLMLDGDTKKPETVAEKFVDLLRETIIYTSPEYITSEKDILEQVNEKAIKGAEERSSKNQTKEKENHEIDISREFI